MMRMLTVLLALAGTAHAAPRVLQVCYPGGTVRARQAKPVITTMVSVLAEVAGLPADSFEARFVNSAERCRTAMADKPALAIVSLGLYLEHRAANHLAPVARPKVKGAATDTVVAVTRKGEPTGLAALKGKRVGGTPLAEPAYLKRVVFEGALDPATDFAEARASKRPLRALRKLHKGALDAVLLTRVQHASLGALPFAGDLQDAWTSAPIPMVGVVADTTQTTAAERAALQKAALALCSHPKGAEMCTMFGLDGFEPASAATYEQAVRAWGG